MNLCCWMYYGLVIRSTCNGGDLGSIPGLEKSPGEGKGYVLQYSGLENSMDSPWGLKERIQLSDFHFHYRVEYKIHNLDLINGAGERDSLF